MTSNHCASLQDAPEHEDVLQPNAKYSIEEERELVKWICSMTSCSESTETGQQGFHDWLKDGQILAKLMNKIKPGVYTPNPPSKSKLPSKRAMIERENINFFTEAVKAYGVSATYVFQVPYLYEQENMYQVQMTLRWLKKLYEESNNKT